MSYHIVEVVSSTKTRTIASEDDFKVALKAARDYSAHTELPIEIQDDLGRVVSTIFIWRD